MTEPSAAGIPQTLTTAENARGGIMVVVPPGYGPAQAPARRSFFSDLGIDSGPVITAFIGWFALWGIDLATARTRDGQFERSFFSLQWPPEPLTDAHGPQQVDKMVPQTGSLAAVIEERAPRLIIVLSCYAWQAMNRTESAAALAAGLGSPLDPGRRITDARLGAFIQFWQKACVLALPLPSKNTTPKYVLSLSQGVHSALSVAGHLPAQALDPLYERALDCLALDREQTVASLRTQLHISQERAQSLFQSMHGRVFRLDASGRAIVKRKF